MYVYKRCCYTADTQHMLMLTLQLHHAHTALRCWQVGAVLPLNLPGEARPRTNATELAMTPPCLSEAEHVLPQATSFTTHTVAGVQTVPGKGHGGGRLAAAVAAEKEGMGIEAAAIVTSGAAVESGPGTGMAGTQMAGMA